MKNLVPMTRTMTAWTITVLRNIAVVGGTAVGKLGGPPVSVIVGRTRVTTGHVRMPISTVITTGRMGRMYLIYSVVILLLQR